MGYSFSYSGDAPGLGLGVALIYGIYLFVVFGFAIAAYVLRALSLYTIAKRRAIHHPWFAWVPVVDMYLLGCISDQYQYVVKGKNKSRRKVLLVLSIISSLFGIVIGGFWIYFVVNTISSASGGMGEMRMVQEMLGMLFGFLGILFFMMCVSIVMLVFRYIALYDLYASCEPRNDTVFLLLSIFFQVVEPFFLFACRNKDQGMPPRRPVYEYQPPESPAEETNWEQTF